MVQVMQHMQDSRVEAEVLSIIDSVLLEVHTLLPRLSKKVSISFDNWCLLPEYGCGGFAYSPEVMTIAFDIKYTDRLKQYKYLRKTVFHEAYHMAQGFTGEKKQLMPIEEAVYEGMATVFERDYTGGESRYGVYDFDKARDWALALATLDQTMDYDAWKFYDSVSGERWRIYKAGAYIIDQALARSSKENIISFNKLTAHDIMKRSEVFSDGKL